MNLQANLLLIVQRKMIALHEVLRSLFEQASVFSGDQFHCKCTYLGHSLSSNHSG